MIKEITSIKNPLISDLIKLKQKKYRLKQQRFLVEGRHLIEEAYQAGSLIMVLTKDNQAFDNVDTYQVNDEIIGRLSDVQADQGMIGVCQMMQNKTLTDKILLLDHLQDPGNMGTLIRSCVAFGFDTIVMDQCVDIYNPKVIRATQGALFKINFQSSPLIDFIKKHEDIHFIATDLSATKSLKSLTIPKSKLGLILGNEGQGIQQEIIDMANDVIKIQIKDMESLNVAVAGSIIMYQLGG